MLGVRPITPKRLRVNMVAGLTVALIAAGALGYFVWERGATPLLAAVRFEMRLAESRPMPGLVVAQDGKSERLIYLHPEIVVSNDDVAQSWVTPDESGGFSVGVVLLPSGADRIQEATSRHLGRPLAILIDGSVVTAPVVRSPINDSAVIGGHYTQDEANRIAEGISRH